MAITERDLDSYGLGAEFEGTVAPEVTQMEELLSNLEPEPVDDPEEKFLFDSLSEVAGMAGVDNEGWKKISESTGGDFLKRDRQEWVYRTEDEQEISISNQVQGEAAQERSLRILGKLYSQGFAISDHRQANGALWREIYFADKTGAIQYEIHEMDREIELLKLKREPAEDRMYPAASNPLESHGEDETEDDADSTTYGTNQEASSAFVAGNDSQSEIADTGLTLATQATAEQQAKPAEDPVFQVIPAAQKDPVMKTVPEVTTAPPKDGAPPAYQAAKREVTANTRFAPDAPPEARARDIRSIGREVTKTSAEPTGKTEVVAPQASEPLIKPVLPLKTGKKSVPSFPAEAEIDNSNIKNNARQKRKIDTPEAEVQEIVSAPPVARREQAEPRAAYPPLNAIDSAGIKIAEDETSLDEDAPAEIPARTPEARAAEFAEIPEPQPAAATTVGGPLRAQIKKSAAEEPARIFIEVGRADEIDGMELDASALPFILPAEILPAEPVAAKPEVTINVRVTAPQITGIFIETGGRDEIDETGFDAGGEPSMHAAEIFREEPTNTGSESEITADIRVDSSENTEIAGGEEATAAKKETPDGNTAEMTSATQLADQKNSGAKTKTAKVYNFTPTPQNAMAVRPWMNGLYRTARVTANATPVRVWGFTSAPENYSYKSGSEWQEGTNRKRETRDGKSAVWEVTPAPKPLAARAKQPQNTQEKLGSSEIFRKAAGTSPGIILADEETAAKIITRRNRRNLELAA